MLSPHCTVLRDSVEREVDAAALVPGDIVLLNIGDRVPADLRLTDVLNLRVDESSLTGESAPVSKSIEPAEPAAILAERSSMAWMGTSVTNGRARGVAVATGMTTDFGRIAQLTQTVGVEATPLQRKLGLLGKHLGILAIGISVVVGTTGWLLLAWTVTVGLQVCAVYVPFLQQALHTVPLGWADWGLMLVVAAPIFLITETVKWYRRRWARLDKETVPDPYARRLP